jgi:hypothetical protein
MATAQREIVCNWICELDSDPKEMITISMILLDLLDKFQNVHDVQLLNDVDFN